MEKVAGVVERVARSIAPKLRTQTKWGHPWLVGNDLVLLVGAFSHHVGIEFWRGSSLNDPRGLLEGTGKNLRHVKIRTMAEAKSPAFASLVREAVKLDSISPRRAR